MLAIVETNPLPGVWQYDSDGASDTLVIESTGTPGEIEVDDGTGLGSHTVTGVNSVIFNGMGGNDELIISMPADLLEADSGSLFQLTFNGDAGNDVIILGGGLSSFTGSYTPSGPEAGTLAYMDGGDTANTTFDDVERIDDSLTASDFVANFNGGIDTVNVEDGPLLVPVASFTQGPVYIDGGDRDDHGSFSAGANQNGWKFIEQVLDFVHTASFNGAGSDVLVIGATHGDARNAVESAANVLGIGYTHKITPAEIAAVNFDDYKVVYVPSNDNNTGGGISSTNLIALAARKLDIASFVRDGGGIMAQTEQDDGVNAYAWLEIPDLFTTASSFKTTQRQTTHLADAFNAAGLQITNAQLTNGTPTHNRFTGPAGFNGLDPWVVFPGGTGATSSELVDLANGGEYSPTPHVPSGTVVSDPSPGDDHIIALGQGGIQDTIGGGQSLQINDRGTNAFTTINVTQKVQVDVEGGGGGDDLRVDITPALGVSALTTLNVLGETGDDFVEVRATPASVDTTVEGGDNDDRIEIGNTSDSLDQIGDDIVVNGNGGSNELYLYDHGDAVNKTYDIDDTTVVRTDGVARTFQYDGLDRLVVEAGSDNDTINVNFGDMNPAGLTGVTISGNDGDDEFHIQSNSAPGAATELLGDDDEDKFIYDAGANILRGSIDGGAQNDQLDYDAYAAARLIELQGFGTIDGFQGDDVSMPTDSLTGGFDNIDEIIGTSLGGDTLRMASGLATHWDLQTANAGQLIAADVSQAGKPTVIPLLPGGGQQDLQWSAFENLVGDLTANDRFDLRDGVTLSGTIDGRGGNDSIDYRDFTTNINVNLTTGVATNVAGGLVPEAPNNSSIENVYGGDGDDAIRGDVDDNILGDGFGSDELFGESGDDVFFLEPNPTGTDSDDHLFDLNGSDTVDFSCAHSTIMIDMDLLDTQMDVMMAAGDQFVTLHTNPGVLPLSPFENVIGSPHDEDLFWVDALSVNGDDPTAGPPVARTVNGNTPHGAGDNDTLYFDGHGQVVQQTSLSVSIPGVGTVNHISVGNVVIHNQRPLIIDNGDFGFDFAPDPILNGNHWGPATANYGGDAIRGETYGDADKFASWTASLAPGSFRVSATWVPDPTLSTDATFVVSDGIHQIGQVSVDQTGAPDDFRYVGFDWETLGVFDSVDGVLEVLLGNSLTGAIFADAVMFEPVSPGPELTVLMDGVELVTDAGLGVDIDTVINRDLTRLVTLRNDGDIQVEIIELNLVSVDPIVLGAPAPTLPIQLDPGESLDFPVILQAQTHGDFTAQIQLVSNDVDENIKMKPGAGLLPPDFDVDPFTFDIFGHVSDVFILDNGDVNFSTSGDWLGPDGDGYLGDDTWNVADGDGTSTATWLFPNIPADLYNVAVTWKTELGASAPSAQFEVFDGTSSLASVNVDQQVAPADFQDAGVSWHNLGQFDITNGEIQVVLTDAIAGGPLQSIIADAVRIERVVNPDLQLLDVANGNAHVPDDTGSIDFGDTSPFDPVQQTFTLSNPAGSSGPITVGEPTLPAGFTLISFGGNPPTGSLTQVLAAGATVDFIVQLDAGWPGLVDGRMEIPVTEPGAPGTPPDLAFNPYDVQLRGTVTGTQIIDDSDSAPAFVLTGTWLGPNGDGYNGTDRWTNSAGTAVWTFERLDPDVFYRVAGSWKAEPFETEPLSDFTVGHVDGNTLVQKDQRIAGDDFIDRNVSWEEFGFFRPTAGGQLTVTLTDPNPGSPDNNFVTADAIRIDPMAAPTIRMVEGATPVESGDTLDFGTTPQGSNVVRTLTLQNFGQVPMPLGQIDVGPGWIVGGAPQLLPPAGPGGPGTAALTLTLDATNAGNFLSPLSLLHGDPILPPVELQLQGQVVGSAPEIIDNADAGFAPGVFTLYGGQGFQADVHAAVGQTADVATWTFDLAALGLPNNATYRVSATWSAQNNRDSAVPFRILDNATQELTTAVDQTIAPDDLFTTDDGGTFWEDLGNVHIDNNFLVVEISNNVPLAVVADAIRIEQLSRPELDLFDGATPIPHLTGSILLPPTPTGTPLPLPPLTISNPGAATLQLQSLVLPAGFSVVGAAPTNVAANGTATLNLQLDANAPGTYAGHVLIPSNDSDETPYKFFVSGVVENPLAVIDNNDAGYTTGGFTQFLGQGHLNDVAFSAANAGNSATWSYTAPTIGFYRVSTTWTSQSNRATNASYDLQVNAASSSMMSVNQEVAPNDFSELGVVWEDLGVVEATAVSDVLSVVLTDTADDFVIGDAVRFELITAPEIHIVQDADILTDNASTVAFGDTSISTPVAKSFTISNIGGANLTINPAVTVPAGFSLTTAPPATIAPGATGTFVVTFDAAAEGNFGGVVSVLSNDSDESPFEINVTAAVVPAGAAIVDNDDPGFTQSGFSFWSDANAFDAELRYAAGDNTGDAAEYAFTGLTPGVYSVSATWIPHSNRATNAPFEIYNGTSADPLIQTVDVNQQVAPNDFTESGSFWEELPGIITITGSTLTVRLTDDANGYVIADAVRVERLVNPEIQVTLSGVGGVNVPDNVGTADFGQLFATQTTPQTFTVTNVGGAPLTLSSVPVATGEYAVTNSFAAATVLAAGASTTFEVTFQPTSLGTLAGTVSFGNDDADENPYNFNLTGTSVDHLIVDDGDADFTASGFTSWSTGFQSDLDYSAGDNTGDTATSTFNGIAPGQYRVSATWVEHANRATDAPFVVDGGGAIDIDQQVAPSGFTANGGTWDDLVASHTFAGGNLVVSLSDDADGFVIADAVRIEYLGPFVASAPAIDSDAAALTLADAYSAVQEAIRTLSEFDPHAAKELQGVDVLVHDLGDNTLGLAAPSSRAIMLDTNAAGYGWSIHTGTGVDLQSVVQHELGHLLGIGHSEDSHSLMTEAYDVSATQLQTQLAQPTAANFWQLLDTNPLRTRTVGSEVESEQTETLDALAPLDSALADEAIVDERVLKLIVENENDVDSIDNFFAELDDENDDDRTAD